MLGEVSRAVTMEAVPRGRVRCGGAGTGEEGEHGQVRRWAGAGGPHALESRELRHWCSKQVVTSRIAKLLQSEDLLLCPVRA